jgi:two-component system phosphate regulon response regulator PhoB
MMAPGQKVRILVADGDEHASSVVRSHLESAGFEVISAASAEEAVGKVRGMNPALVIFDTMIPGMSGTDFLRTLRSTPATCNIPIVALSERAGEIDRIVGLELGADDYVSKPFSARELTLRVKAILSRCPAAPPKPERFRMGRLMLDLPNHEFSIDGVPVSLTALEFRLLLTLLREGGRVVSREQLIEQAWGPDSEVSQRTVDTQLRRLRVKLGAAAEQIQTVRGFGYRLGE